VVRNAVAAQVAARYLSALRAASQEEAARANVQLADALLQLRSTSKLPVKPSRWIFNARPCNCPRIANG